MSARRISDKAVTIPENASFVDFPRSDGNSRTWPTNTTAIVDSEGHVNFMQYVDIESSAAIRWRISVGQAAAVALELPVGPEYVLRDWPEGYRLYDHHKGIESNPRHDLYLFGPGSGRRFRSINEFIPHAIWLLKDTNMDSSNCLCKYCAKRTQKEVTASMPGILRSTSGSQSPTPSRPKTQDKTKSMRKAALKNERNNRETRVYAAVQKTPKPIISKSAHVSNRQAMLVERNSDLRAVHSKSGMRLKRWFRVGELLWCGLNPPIAGPNVSIKFWPGLVDETRLKTEPIPQSPPKTNGSPTNHERMDCDDAANDSSSSATWAIRQSTVYKMQLLGVSHSILLDDTEVLPYQSHLPPNELLNALRLFPIQELNFDRGKLATFNPCPEGSQASLDAAVAPYALALEMASAISGFWCPTDEWPFEYTLSNVNPPEPPTSSTSSDPGPSSLQAVLEAASLHNAKLTSTLPYNPQYYRNVYAPDTNISATERQRLSERVLGKPPILSPQSPRWTQVRFQGLWWGAERIWTDDFVRIKLPRRAIAPAGGPNILSPSGPGKEAREAFIADGHDPAQLGAGSRGVFMRLDGLYMVDAVQPNGQTKKECRASGMLYELADLDWHEDPIVLANSALSQPTSSQAAHSLSTAPIPSTSQPPRNINNAASSNTQINTPPISTQLSQPSSSPYLLPAAPEGYRFRQILPNGYEAVFSLSLLSGRYYPRILSHPLLAPILKEAMSDLGDPDGLFENDNLWALEGLSGGFLNSVDPSQYRPSRIKMVEDADKLAITALETRRLELLAKTEEEQDDIQLDDLAYPDQMDVDVS